MCINKKNAPKLCKLVKSKIQSFRPLQRINKLYIMDVIMIESKAFKELEAKINTIADYILNRQEAESINEDEIWVDSYEVCTFLKISDKTLQRLRVAGIIAYSNIRGRYFYKIGEIKRMLEERLIRSNTECLNDLVTNHKLYVKERRNLRKNK